MRSTTWLLFHLPTPRSAFFLPPKAASSTVLAQMAQNSDLAVRILFTHFPLPLALRRLLRAARLEASDGLLEAVDQLRALQLLLVASRHVRTHAPAGARGVRCFCRWGSSGMVLDLLFAGGCCCGCPLGSCFLYDKGLIRPIGGSFRVLAWGEAHLPSFSRPYICPGQFNPNAGLQRRATDSDLRDSGLFFR